MGEIQKPGTLALTLARAGFSEHYFVEFERNDKS